MNLQHMKYAVAVAETGSINKAADRLFVGQSNLSRAPAISRRPLPVFPASFPPMRSLKSSTRKPTLCVP